MTSDYKLAILGAGNIGTAIAKGLVKSNYYQPQEIILTRRKIELLETCKKENFNISRNNIEAVKNSSLILVAVEPQQINHLLNEIKEVLDPDRHILISVISGVKIRELQTIIGPKIPVIRAMPNTAIAIQESMTCIVTNNGDKKLEALAESIFSSVGKTLLIDEEQMTAATALASCGIAFFFRAVRAASQGGIEIGFHSEEALFIAAQTAKGAVELLLNKENHPESEIDKVTTPRGCTISGLNQMEHEGFSSAMIKGIITSAQKASCLYMPENI